MKKYIVVIVLIIIAIIAIIVRVSNKPELAGQMNATSTVPSLQSATTSKPATVQKTYVGPTGSTVRPTPSYPRGETFVDNSQFTSMSADGAIRTSSPAKNAVVTSPVRVVGEAQGNWYFEGVFHAVVTDANGVVIGQAVVPANGNWMTAKMVPFDFSVSFNQQVAGTRGHIILKKDNPSGLPQNNASLDIPIVFK